ncbi:MAG: response regulator transcription factor [Elusimicrobia bacterium]|nr:response regulator transcription factor [Elusimicrobiota bacterium]
MQRQRVLVVEDEAPMREFYRRFFAHLAGEGYSAMITPTAEQALEALALGPQDLVVLDWHLPGITGAHFTKALRAHARTRSMGILVVSALGAPANVVAALEAGADDHLAKPFDEKVLQARLRSLARRRTMSFDAHYARNFPGLELDLNSERLILDGRPVSLSPKEMELFKIFLQRPDVLHSHAYLWEAAWGYESTQWHHVLVATLSTLRGKLGRRWASRLRSIHGRGYVLYTKP